MHCASAFINRPGVAGAVLHSPATVNCNGCKCGCYLINIVKRSLLRSYRLLQVERGPCRAGIAETGRQVACKLIRRRKRQLDGAVYF